MLISFVLVSSLLLIDSSTGCCCNIKWSCGCNAFGCNCVTVNGWCKKVYDSVTHGGHVLIQPLCSNPGFGFNSGCTVCWSSQGKKDQEYCPAERRRMKRSTTIAQAYGNIHPDLIDRHEMETFLRFDLNRDGLISLEEANRSINTTIEQFAQVDANNDGFVHPAEFDASLKWFKRFQRSKQYQCMQPLEISSKLLFLSISLKSSMVDLSMI